MKSRIVLFLFIFVRFSLVNGEAQQTAACGFGFEMLLSKLEAIEERLIALEAKLENVSTKKGETEKPRAMQNADIVAVEPLVVEYYFEHTTAQTVSRVKPNETPKYPVGIEPTAEELALGEDNIYSSCREVPSRVSGKYLIRISDDAQPINLLCDMQSVDVGWVVVQNRFNGSESFYRSWKDYEEGFGNLDGEFWLGLERISTMVNNGRKWEILFWLKNFNGEIHYSKFSKFMLGNAKEGYALKQVAAYTGNAGDSISRHAGNKFTTFDRDNDPAPYNCAKKHRGAWWYHRTCVNSNLNGMYGFSMSDQANSWLTMKPTGYGLQASKIMIRELL